jgi:cupin superfamily acireductone dioxygenase involved in methionine salvage
MGTKIVSVTIERHYSKQATIEVEVDENLKDEELQTFLTESEEIDTLLEGALSFDTLSGDETIYEYQDPTNNDGGHL